MINVRKSLKNKGNQRPTCTDFMNYLSNSNVCACRSRASAPEVKRIAKGVNGPLLEALALKAGWHDAKCIEFFRTGAPLVDTLLR